MSGVVCVDEWIRNEQPPSEPVRKQEAAEELASPEAVTVSVSMSQPKDGTVSFETDDDDTPMRTASARRIRTSEAAPLAGSIEEAMRGSLATGTKEFGTRASIGLNSKLKPQLLMVEQRDAQMDKIFESKVEVGEHDDIEDLNGQGKVVRASRRDYCAISVVGATVVCLVAVLCVWAQNGLLPEDHVGHIHSTKTRVGHVHAPLLSAPADLALTTGTGREVFDVRIIAESTQDWSHKAHGRRLGQKLDSRPLYDLGSALRPRFRGIELWRRLGGGGASRPKPTHTNGVTGNLTYSLLVDGKIFCVNTIKLEEFAEVEHFQTLELSQYTTADGIPANEGEDYSLHVDAQRSDGLNVAFAAQVIRMNSAGLYRFHIGLGIFIITFASIVAERVHRSYAAFAGATATICALAAIQETPTLHQVTAMIDYGTLMLLFSMMILMQMLAMTGFFNWAAVQTIAASKQNPVALFFLLTNICGFASMVLDNVTCVLLTGPLTYQVAKKMQLNPRALYVSMTICATIGGTGTYIGDPPNIVIGSKLGLSFDSFLKWNLPIVSFVFLPVSSGLLYWRFSDKLRLTKETSEKLDIAQLAQENRITDEPMFGKLGVCLFGILVALLLSPIHHIEPAWFCVMAMISCAVMFDHHHFGRCLEFVEWDTLFFFALLFVLVESLSELGVIRTLGDSLVTLMELPAVENRMYFAIILILWVSGIGSAFLESLPYTTTIVYIIKDLMRDPDKMIDGVNIPTLCWPLSVGACVGGIGSIMGSSANLVCMAISARYAETEDDTVKGSDFLKYGLPTLIVLLVIASLWQLFLFVWLDINPAEH